MPDAVSRRRFLRMGATGAVAFLAACSRGEQITAGSPTPTPGSPSPSPTIPTSPPAAPTPTTSPSKAPTLTGTWKKLASGPQRRRDHSLTAETSNPTIYLFGGRRDGQTRDDLWIYQINSNSWERFDATGPAKRLGHNAAFINGTLWVFGGQDGATFYNDLWRFDFASENWFPIETGNPKPGRRYGAGGDVRDGTFWMSHGFSNSGRFADTWSFKTAPWKNQTPGGPKPVKRCLHQLVYLASIDRFVLFGGQTDGTLYLGDTWLLNPTTNKWTELKIGGPSARNLYAAAATKDRVWLVGGDTKNGASNEVWSFDGDVWSKVSTSGGGPGERFAMNATIRGNRLYVFGGTDGSNEKSDLWALDLPG